MKLRTKIILGTILVVVITLAVFSWVTELQVSSQVDKFIREFQPGGHMDPRRIKLIETVRKSMWWTFIGATGISTLLSLLFAHSIVDPIQRLTDATKAIAAGKYKNRINTDRSDEIGELTTSLNQMAETLERNQALQRDLITNVSHELGTPLTSMKGYIEALSDGIITAKSKRQDALRIVKEETERLENMLREVRELALIQDAGFKIKRRSFSLKKSVQKTLASLRPLAKKKDIKIKLSDELSQTSVSLDEAKLKQILVNLIGNAIKFSPEKSTIQIHLWDEEKQTKISIQDEGPGISKKDQARIFDRFVQLDHARKGEGTGLGLAIVKELVEAHNGSIELESSPEGSRFTLIF